MSADPIGATTVNMKNEILQNFEIVFFPVLHLVTLACVSYYQLVSVHPVVINVPCESGNTPLHWAAREGNSKICEVLLSKGASKDIKNSDGRTPEQEAKYKNKDSVAKLIWEYPDQTKH